MSGSVAYGFHEGGRSEYLAQYAFASWGTAVAVPHHEDHGLDLLCTFMEQFGSRALARWPFTVQVKSGMEPYFFEGRDAVRWVVEHPLPLYLCVVDKASCRISVYHTFPRFHAWTLANLALDRLELVPDPADGSPGQCVEWQGGARYSLGQPILDFTIAELHQRRAEFGRVLAYWLGVENENLTTMRTGLLKFRMPRTYHTNRTDNDQGWSIYSTVSLGTEYREQVVDHLVESLDCLTLEFVNQDNLVGAAIAALLHRHLCPGPRPARGRQGPPGDLAMARLLGLPEGPEGALLTRLTEMLERELRGSTRKQGGAADRSEWAADAPPA